MVWTITYTVRDDRKRAGRMTFYLPDTVTVADAIAWANENAVRIDPLLQGAFDGATLTQALPLSGLGLKTTPSGAADINEKMVITYQALNGYKIKFAMPAFDEAFAAPVIRSNYRVLDFLQPEPNNMVNLHTQAVAAGFASNIVNKRGDLAARVNKTKQTFFRNPK